MSGNARFQMIGGTSFKGKEYTIADNKGIISATSLGLVNFYGGRVKNVGKTKVKGLYLCIEGSDAIDLIKFDDEVEVVETPEPETDIAEETDPNETVVFTDDEELTVGVSPTPDSGIALKLPEPEPTKAPNLPRPANRSKGKK